MSSSDSHPTAEGTRSRAGVVGVVLAGGASRRMGRDKARMRLGGETLAESAVRRLAAVCAEVVVADRGRGLVAGAPSVDDGPGAGPAAALLGAAAARPGRDLLALACDLPHVPEPLLAALAAVHPGDWVVPRWRDDEQTRLEPLCALYRPPALAALRRRVDQGRLALHELTQAEELEVRHLDDDVLATFGSPDRLFHNLNSPDDWPPADPPHPSPSA